MANLQALYPLLDAPYPTLITHTDNGLGIFIVYKAATKDSHLSLIKQNKESLTVSVNGEQWGIPLSDPAQEILSDTGGMIILTDEDGIPWYSIEMKREIKPVMEEGEFSL